MKEDFLQWQGEKDAIDWANKTETLIQEIQIIIGKYSKV